LKTTILIFITLISLFFTKHSKGQTTYTVTSNANTGVAGTLRWAVAQCNTVTPTGPNVICFSLTAAQGTISLGTTSAIACITLTANSTTINGFNNLGAGGAATPNTVLVKNTTVGSPLNPAYKVTIKGPTSNINSFGYWSGAPQGCILEVQGSNNIIKGICFSTWGVANHNTTNTASGTSCTQDIGLLLSGTSNTVIGCYFGMDKNGLLKQNATGDVGICITSHSNCIGNGTAAGANLISGISGGNAGYGVLVYDGNDNKIQGNLIGLQKDGINTLTVTTIGTTATYNRAASYGVGIIGNATTTGTNNLIGGSGADDGNVISGNGFWSYMQGLPSAGIYIAAQQNTIKGNIIGCSTSGLTRTDFLGVGATGASSNGIMGCQDVGVLVANNTGSLTTIGGIGTYEGNLISGNGAANATYNVEITNYCTVIGNKIGGDITGTAALSQNGNTGAYYLAGAAFENGIKVTGQNNVIGGRKSFGYGNLITSINYSGHGIYLYNQSFPTDIKNNSIKGNIIGLNAAGTGTLTNMTLYAGTLCEGISWANQYIVGDTIGGDITEFGNVISGLTNGIAMRTGYNQGSDGVKVFSGGWIIGNIIGLQKDGISKVTQAYPQKEGIHFELFGKYTSFKIGDGTYANRNIISNNSINGISVGMIANQVYGFLNLIPTASISINGNHIGVDKNGNAIASHTQATGVELNCGSKHSVIGNVISGNSGYGLRLLNTDSTAIKGNYIGVLLDGVTANGNTTDGIAITATTTSATYASQNNCSLNVIGGSAAGEPNILANNGSDGIEVTSSTDDFNLITQNSIYCNANKGINLLGVGNNNMPAPVITSSTAVGADGTAQANAVVELFYNHTCSGCQGKTYIGSVTANGAGAWSYVGTINTGTLTATATDATKNTSEFSNCDIIILPIELLYLKGNNYNNENVITWQTATETNNHYFTVEKSNDGVNFIDIGIVNGAGTSLQLNSYSLIDKENISDIKYYRLKQTDFNGSYKQSTIISIENDQTTLTTFPIPASSVLNFYIGAKNLKSTNFAIVKDIYGRVVFETQIASENDKHIYTINIGNLAQGMYFLNIGDKETKFIKQ
jgi:hypothetical protein